MASRTLSLEPSGSSDRFHPRLGKKPNRPIKSRARPIVTGTPASIIRPSGRHHNRGVSFLSEKMKSLRMTLCLAEANNAVILSKRRRRTRIR